jgi:hypothetical protein
MNRIEETQKIIEEKCKKHSIEIDDLQPDDHLTCLLLIADAFNRGMLTREEAVSLLTLCDKTTAEFNSKPLPEKLTFHCYMEILAQIVVNCADKTQEEN